MLEGNVKNERRPISTIKRGSGFLIRSVFGFPPSPIRYMPGNIIRTNKQETNKWYRIQKRHTARDESVIKFYVRRSKSMVPKDPIPAKFRTAEHFKEVLP